MNRSLPWALRVCRDRPEVWSGVGMGSLAAALVTLSIGPEYGFASLLFLLGAVVALGRAVGILRGDGGLVEAFETAGGDVAPRDD